MVLPGLSEQKEIRVETELTGPVDLCRDGARLNPDAVGWSRHPVQRCAIPGWGRRKRWDYWCVTAENLLLAVTVSSVDYLGLASLYFCDLGTGEEVDKTVVVPGALGIDLPETVGGGPIVFDRFGLRIEMVPDETGTRLLVATRHKGRQLDADLHVALPAQHETLNVVIPWSPTRFQFTSKHNARPAQGHVTYGGVRRDLGGDNPAYGCLDFGRGVWPYRVTWNWGSASGEVSGRTVGLQLGGTWTDGTGATENSITVDGKLTKISDDLRWSHSPVEPMQPWRIVTARSGQVDLTFTPRHVHATRIELGVAGIDLPQYLGTYDGTVVIDGESMEISDLFGWAEDARMRW